MPTHRSATSPTLDPTTSGGGSSAQVFEVTGLVIPSGTDWSSGHALGSVDLVPPWAFIASIHFATAAPPVDNCQLMIWGPQEDWQAATWTSSVIATGPPFVTVGLDMHTTNPTTTEAIGFYKADADLETKTAYCGFVTQDGPTTEDITVSARVAVLVI